MKKKWIFEMVGVVGVVVAILLSAFLFLYLLPNTKSITLRFALAVLLQSYCS